MKRYKRAHQTMVFDPRSGLWQTHACICMWCVPQRHRVFNTMSNSSLDALTRWAGTLPAREGQEFVRLLGKGS